MRCSCRPPLRTRMRYDAEPRRRVPAALAVHLHACVSVQLAAELPPHAAAARTKQPSRRRNDAEAEWFSGAPSPRTPNAHYIQQAYLGFLSPLTRFGHFVSGGSAVGCCDHTQQPPGNCMQSGATCMHVTADRRCRYHDPRDHYAFYSQSSRPCPSAVSQELSCHRLQELRPLITVEQLIASTAQPCNLRPKLANTT